VVKVPPTGPEPGAAENLMPSRYLIRIDDICPTMNWSVWSSVEQILTESDVRPLLAVVPDNRDAELDIDPPAADFWERVRKWQAAGWAIGLHGHQHLYTTNDPGLIGRNHRSEFAGVSREVQRAKLRASMEIFRGHSIRADAWIAPAHSFDATTLELLAEIGIDCVSDGYALAPYTENGVAWMPQQIGRFIHFPLGDWTVCLHINAWADAEIASFAGDIEAFRSRITSLGDLRATARARRRGLADRMFDHSMRAMRRLRG